MMEKQFGMELELILFWSTVKAKTINGEEQLHALVDGKKIIITESSVRRDLQLADEDGVDCLLNSTNFENLTLMGPKTTAWNEFSSTMASAIIYEAVYKELGDSLVRAATTASSLEAEQDSGTDKAKITRKRLKPGKNEHGDGRAHKEPEVAKYTWAEVYITKCSHWLIPNKGCHVDHERNTRSYKPRIAKLAIRVSYQVIQRWIRSIQ
ncbi:hypothetical protein Tco_1206859 [Tanacetum coccineum]